MPQKMKTLLFLSLKWMSLNEQIMYLQNEKLQLEERMHDFVANKVNFFHNRKYDDNICAVYQDLLCMGLST